MTESVELLLRLLNANDTRAAELIFQHFSKQLNFLAQQRLGLRLRRQLDPEDVVQSAFMSFFEMQASQKVSFENADALWGLLSLITIRKCGHKIEYFGTKMRNAGCEQSGLLNSNDADASRAAWEAVAQDPSPSHVAIHAETIDGWLRGLDERDRIIMTLRLENYDVAEISEKIGRSEQTIRRVLKRSGIQLQRVLYPSSAGS